MGTYDSRGGSPRHDPAADFEPVIFPEEDAALAILEAAGVDSQVNDQIVKIVGQTAGRVAELTRALLDLRELVRRGDAPSVGKLPQDSLAGRWYVKQLHDAVERECRTAGL